MSTQRVLGRNRFDIYKRILPNVTSKRTAIVNVKKKKS